MKLLILVASLLSLVVSQDVRELFRQAMAKFAEADGILKSESPAKMEKRFRSFLKFHAIVEEVNNDKSLPYTAADNFMSILTEEERMLRLGLNITGHEVNVNDDKDVVLLSDSDIPAQRDFSKVISDVKDQDTCGSCWTFSATGALEGEIYFKTGTKKVSLSEREYMECVNTNKNACKGGWPTDCYDYSVRSDRLAPTSAYPYAARDRRSCYVASNTANALADNNVKVTGFKYFHGRDDNNLLAAAATHILSVAIYANGYFHAYNDGMYIDSRCQDKGLNHAVNVVGYGVHSSGNKYWKIRNSWGPFWGEKGYMFMDRDKQNMCQIASWPHIPLVACRNGGCVAPNPDDGDSSGEEKEFNYKNVCWTKHFLSECIKKKKSKKGCKNKEECFLVRTGKNCKMNSRTGNKKGDDDNYRIDLPSQDCNVTSTGEQKNCREKLFLSGCLLSRADAVQFCEREVEVKNCLIVKSKNCYHSTTSATSGSRWIKRPVKC